MTAEKKKSIKHIAADLKKKYGEVIQFLSEMPPPQKDALKSGSLAMDRMLGGGYCKGRVVELAGHESGGKSLLAMSACAAAQRDGKIAAYIDTEYALNVDFAKAIGVDVGKLILIQPDSAEDALDITLQLAKDGVDIVVLDSVAAMIPKRELEKDSGELTVGEKARLMSTALPKIAQAAAKSGSVVIFINQIREKIGVMYGCFNYGARIVLEDGSTEKIGKLVNQRRRVRVKTFDHKTGNVSSAEIKDYHENGNAKEFLQITTEKCGGNGLSQFGVTANHLIATPTGDRKAGDLRIGDEVLGVAKLLYNDIQMQVVAGSILGDGSIRKGKSGTTTCLRFLHGAKQAEYCKWKASLFDGAIGSAGTRRDGAWGFDTVHSVDMNQIHEEAYSGAKGRKNGRRMSESVLKSLTPLSVAIWYMDDGSYSGSHAKWGHGKSTISCMAYSGRDIELLCDRLEEIGIPRPTSGARNRLTWSGDACGKFQSMIAKFVHPSMNYKLKETLHNEFEDIEVGESPVREIMVPKKIVDIHVKPKTRSMKKFDLTVAGTHRYIVDGVGVHNSPETTPGGRSLKFSASIRIFVNRKETIKVGEKAVGIVTKAKTVKNKLAPPYREALVSIYFDRGIDQLDELADIAFSRKVLVARGAGGVMFGDERIAPRKDAVTAAIKESKDLQDRILAAIESAEAGPQPDLDVKDEAKELED